MKKARKENPVGWFEIYVQDLRKARSFYEKTLEVKLEALPSPKIKMLAFPFDMKAPGGAGAIVKMKGKCSGIGGTIVYFSCEDCAVTEARAAKAGGQVHLPKTSIGQYGFISLVLDPDGNLIGLHSQK